MPTYSSVEGQPKEENLPRELVYQLDDEDPLGSECVEFRLVYDGRLRAEGRKHSRADDKHIIRKVLNQQLRELWDTSLLLSDMKRHGIVDDLANDFQRGDGFKFAPLINEKYGGAYAMLDILFLRRSDPGKLIDGSGDIDNRIKTLFDALKVPAQRSEIDSDGPEEDETPFYCLLQDDSLITSLKVTTDRLLWPLPPEAPSLPKHPLSDVVLVIHVKTGVYNPRQRCAEIFW